MMTRMILKQPWTKRQTALPLVDINGGSFLASTLLMYRHRLNLSRVNFFSMRPFLLLTMWLLTLAPALAQSDTWQLAKDEAGIQVYTRKVAGEPLKAFRATAIVEASAEAILATLTDVARGSEWMDRCAESRIIERSDDANYVAYTLIETPWPLQARDIVSRVEIRREGNQITCLMTNAPDAYPTQDDVVRMPRYHGKWVLTPQGNGRTQVTSEGLASPGGGVPDWLANTEVVDSPYKTLANLRARVEG
jgi:ribosome-associated toxin RatA of RatAB toxin-antitoxin module